MGAFVAFYLWKAVFDSSQEPLIQGFSMADITLYIIMRLLRPVHFSASYLFTELGSKWLIFISVGLPFLSEIILMKILSGQGIVEVLGLTTLYLFSLTLAYLINFFFNICFGFTAFVFKNLWGSNLLKTSIVTFMSGRLIPLAFFPKIVSTILSLLPFSSLIYTPVMIIVGKYDASQMLQALLLLFLALSDGGLVSVDLETSPAIYHHSRRLV